MSDDSPDTDGRRQVWLGMDPADDGEGYRAVGADAVREMQPEVED